jgi:hypothetical protein
MIGAGRLLLPGIPDDKTRFLKEMRKLENKWAVDMATKYRPVRLSARKWASLADEIVEVLIATDTETIMRLISGLDYGDEAYWLAVETAKVMGKYGAILVDPSGATRDPGDFFAESQAWLEKAIEQRARDHGLTVERYLRATDPQLAYEAWVAQQSSSQPGN